MSTQENLKLGKNIYELFNHNKIEELANFFSEDATLTHIPTNSVFKGREGYKQATMIWKNAFSDARCEVKNLIASEDYIVTEFDGIGTHDGILQTPMGSVNPTWKKVRIPFTEIMKIKNGKIVEYRLYFDSAALLQQLELATQNV